MADARHEDGVRGPGGEGGTAAGRGAVPRRSTLLLRGLLIFELLNAAYLAAFDSATIFYHAQVVAHVAAGFLIVLVVIARGLPALGPADHPLPYSQRVASAQSSAAT